MLSGLCDSLHCWIEPSSDHELSTLHRISNGYMTFRAVMKMFASVLSLFLCNLYYVFTLCLLYDLGVFVTYIQCIIIQIYITQGTALIGPQSQSSMALFVRNKEHN